MTERTADTVRAEAAERRFLLLFLPIAFGFGGRMALVAFNGPLVRLFTDNGYLIGLLLAVGPLVAAFVNPAVGRLSDRTWTRFGRRIPFAVVGVPLSALVLFAIPSAPSVAVLLVFFLLRALLISIGGVPLLSLIPDMTAPERRGRAMSLLMIAGGIGAILIQASGKLFWESRFELVFYLTGALGLVTMLPLFGMREPRPPAHELAVARGRAGLSLRAAWRALRSGEPIALFLASASLRQLSVGIVMTYFTLFAVTDLGVPVGDAALAIAITGGARLLLAIPAGRLADAWSRKKLLLGTHPRGQPRSPSHGQRGARPARPLRRAARGGRGRDPRHDRERSALHGPDAPRPPRRADRGQYGAPERGASRRRAARRRHLRMDRGLPLRLRRGGPLPAGLRRPAGARRGGPGGRPRAPC
jgi:MFS family permease